MNKERGQALIIAMLALAIGALVVVPFLSHAGTSLISSRVYGQTIAEKSASDAGVEHAIWSLTRGTLAKQFSQSGDQVTYQLGETLNGYSTTVTVTANATSQGGTLGDIANAVIDTLVFDNSSGYLPSMIMVSGNICAIAYRGASNLGYVRTAFIDSNGNINNAYIDSLTFDTNSCYEPKIVNVSGTTYAIVYRRSSNRGYLATMSIDTAGNIGNAVLKTLSQFDSNTCYEPYIVNVSGTTYAIVYRGGAGGTTNYGYIRTVSISADGKTITAIIASKTFVSSTCYEPEILPVSGSIFAIAYRGGASNYGYLSTISISADGKTISSTPIATVTFNNSAAILNPSLIQVSGSTYAVTYDGLSNYGYITTISIPASGTPLAVIKTSTFVSSVCYEPDISLVTGSTFAIAYRGTSNDGYLKTMSIAANGDIGASVIDTLEFDTSNCYEPVIVSVTGGIFAIAYRGVNNDGYLVTVGITTEAAVAASWQIVSTAGNTSIRAYVNTANTTANITSWQIK